MSVRFACAKVLSAASTWGLKNVFHRAAGNFPGQIALKADPAVLAHARSKAKRGSICVVGTNGKTTCTNLLADIVQASGQQVICNRGGANLKAGIVAAMLQSPASDWAVMECDEMWLAHVLPDLKSNYVLLLNLFADQLDRVGDISHVQDSIVRALESSPDTVLLYNGDDPRCAAIAQRVSNKSMAFGLAHRMDLTPAQPESVMCHQCGALLQYDYVQYGQLGSYQCPSCDFDRPALDFVAEDVLLGADGLSFQMQMSSGSCDVVSADGTANQRLSASFNGSYMVYNLLACAAAATLMGCSMPVIQRAIDAFDPKNGRLQTYCLQGRRVLLNLAKNPTGFNQNLDIVLQGEGPKAVAFFVNDMEGDGRDVSWLWDVNFEMLANAGAVAVYAGGMRANDVQVRLKYAGISAELVGSADEALDRIQQLSASVNAYMIANYTALPPAKAALDKRVAALGAADDRFGVQNVESDGRLLEGANDLSAEKTDGALAECAAAAESVLIAVPEPNADKPSVVLAHLYPDLLNLYGDAGNLRILEQRLRWRGIPVETLRVQQDDAVDFSKVDLVFLGGGSDRGLEGASGQLNALANQLAAYVEDGGALLAVCGGYQLLGREWLAADGLRKGAGVFGMTSKAAEAQGKRLIDNVVLDAPVADHPVIGYENHAARTFLDEGVRPFGRVTSSTGCGNNEGAKTDGVLHKHAVGTYLHGPALAKNPEVADWLLRAAVERAATRAGVEAPLLDQLDDSCELAANAAVLKQLGR